MDLVPGVTRVGRLRIVRRKQSRAPRRFQIAQKSPCQVSSPMFSGSCWVFFQLIRSTGRTFASLGILITIANLVTGPLTQQLVVYQSKMTPSSEGNATVGAANVFAYDEKNKNLNYETFLMDVAIHSGFGNDPAKTAPLIPSCSSGNCTFPEFQSLGVCHQMANITSFITVDTLPNPSIDNLTLGSPNEEYPIPGVMAQNYSLPDGVGSECYMVTQGTHSLFTCALLPSESLAFKGNDTLMRSRLLSMAIVWSEPSQGNDALPLNLQNNTTISSTSHYGLEVVFYPCVSTFEVHVEQTNPTTRVTSSLPELVDPAFPGFSPLCHCIDGNILTCLGPPLNQTTLKSDDQIVYFKNPQCPQCSDPSDLFGIENKAAIEFAEALYTMLETFMAEIQFPEDSPAESQNQTLWFNVNAGPMTLWKAIFQGDGQHADSTEKFANLAGIFDRVTTTITNL